MAQLDLQIEDKPVRSRNGRQDYRLIQQPRPRGLIAQVTTLLLQPGVFFRTLPALASSRQWLLIAVFILAVTGLMAVRQAELAAATSEPSASPDGMMPPDMMDPRAGGGGAAVSGDLGGLPSDMGMPVDPVAIGGAPSTEDASVSTTWTTALVAGGSLVAAWLLQTLLLSEVTLFNGRAPRLGLNLQVAVYASVPLALMTGLQALYYGAGGGMGAPGLTGLVTEWTGFAGQTPFVQALLMSLASRLTLFWLWSVLLLYFGARHALRGRWWASLLVVFVWVAVVVVAPVLTGAVTAPPTEEAIPTDDMPGMEGGPEMLLEGRPGEPDFEGSTGPVLEAGEGEPASVGRPVLEGSTTDGSASLTEGESLSDSEASPTEGEPASVGRPEVEAGAAGDAPPADETKPEAQEVLPGGG